jgi:hypothetical protein
VKINHPEDLIARIKRLENELAILKRGSTLSGSVLSRGQMEVQTESGQVLQRIGAIPWAGTTVRGIANYRADGSVTSIQWDDDEGNGYWSWYDEAGNSVVSDDTVSGQGLARPYLQYASTPWTQVLTPPELTTLGTFDPMARIAGQKQQPYLRVYLLTQADVGTTGEVQLAIGGSAITAAPTSIPDGANLYQTVDAELPGEHLSIFTVDVEARRVSGAGSIRVGVAFASGRQS